MAPKEKPAKTQPTPITVRYIGNRSIFWVPSSPTASLSNENINDDKADSYDKNDKGKAVSEPNSSKIDEEMKDEYVKFLREDLCRQQKLPDAGSPRDSVEDFEKPRRALNRRDTLALLAVALDPSSKPRFFKELGGDDPVTREDILDATIKVHKQTLSDLINSWSGTGKKSALNPKGRSAADIKAQKDVPSWYGERCVLSGLINPEGAHIIPVRASKTENTSHFWKMLACFYPLPVIDEDQLAVKGREVTNVLPLCPDAHALWDRYAFAMRPIEDPEDPQHKIYIQMIWLKDLDTEGGLVAGNWDHDGCGSIADFRRGADGMYPPVRHGDIYEIVTADSEERPLPSLRLLQIQYGVHRMLAGIRGAGALKIIFSDDPPDDMGPTTHDVGMLPEWDCLLEAAVQAGVLDSAAAGRWGNAFAWDLSYQAEDTGVSLSRMARGRDLEDDSN